MRSVDIEVLRDNLGEYVRAAEAGETVQVTDRDRVVAELVPPRPRLSDEEVIAKGIREGWLRPAARQGPLPEPTHPSVMSFEEMMADLAESREDR